MILIKNSTFFDGVSFKKGDILVKGDRIIRIGNFSSSLASEVISGLGKLTLPGLIDVNPDIDKRLTLFSYQAQQSLLKKGITTIVCGTKGVSLAPLSPYFLKFLFNKVLNMPNLGINFNWQTFNEFLKTLGKSRPLLNIGNLIGYSNLDRFLPQIDHLTIREFFWEEEKKSLGISSRVDKYYFEKFDKFFLDNQPRKRNFKKIISLYFPSANLLESSLKKMEKKIARYRIEITDIPLKGKSNKLISFLKDHSSYDFHFDAGPVNSAEEILKLLPFLNLENLILSPRTDFLKLEKFLPLERIVYKMTKLPAQKFFLKERGVIKEGNYADLAIFSEGKISETIVNGKMIIKEGEFQPQKGKGKVLEYEED